MKAVEYVARYYDYLLGPPLDLWKDEARASNCKFDALIAVCRDMFLEIQEIAKSRNAASDLAFLAICKEQDQKYQAVWRQLKDVEINRFGFRAFLRSQVPEVATQLDWRV